jgi:hypothetical protein
MTVVKGAKIIEQVKSDKPTTSNEKIIPTWPGIEAFLPKVTIKRQILETLKSSLRKSPPQADFKPLRELPTELDRKH